MVNCDRELPIDLAEKRDVRNIILKAMKEKGWIWKKIENFFYHFVYFLIKKFYYFFSFLVGKPENCMIKSHILEAWMTNFFHLSIYLYLFYLFM